ncbi:hypothetical protein [Fictibacillus sp. NRS-1165]|uniref:hypothetical protein n=1 Tax=Fictibacillus sp. NRS-1165 TaxID=3144463 RepID=UPI003D2173FA
MSGHGDVITYQLSPEELEEVIKKYGKPKCRLNKRNHLTHDVNELDRFRYKDLIFRGYDDKSVCRIHGIDKDFLWELKKQWGIVKKG